MTVTNIITLGCGEYEEFIFVLFPHLTTVPARAFFVHLWKIMLLKLLTDRKVLMI